MDWVFGTVQVTGPGIAVTRRKMGPFGKAGNELFTYNAVTGAEMYGSILTLALSDGSRRGFQKVASPEVVAASLEAHGVPTIVEPAGDAITRDGRPQVQVKTYKNEREFQRDAQRMTVAGWRIEGQSSRNQNTAIGRTAGKAVLTGGVGLILMGRSKKGDTITVTWEKPSATPSVPDAVSTQATSTAPDIPSQLKQLAELRDAGILTSEEFDAQKGQLLARM